jgi:DNA-binding response OmpR family regulator
MARIIVVDDAEEVRDLCRTVLVNEGFEVLEAVNAAEGIALTRKSAPDLVLLDWMLPDLAGIDALRVLKGSELTRAVPVVMLTALAGITEIALASQAGADGYVTKPFEVETLLSMVRRSTELKGAPAVLEAG